MSTHTRFAELLLRWQEAREQGVQLHASELSSGDPDIEAELQRRIETLQAMQWMEKLQSASTKPYTIPNGVPNKHWQAGQEPVPGYQLVRFLGRGGFSEVWEASGPGGIPVALKLILADRSFPEEKSLELLKSIRHPRIVSNFGAWSVESGFAIAMELADESLHERWIKLDANETDRIELSRLALIACAEALDCLNIQHHIQHRDVKPQNMLLFGDYIKLADFGIAKAVENHSTGHTGNLTVAYAPPEFFQGRSAASSDQYSLAITYTLLRTGQLPFVGNSAQMTYCHLHRTPDLKALPSGERNAVMRALSKYPRDRWPTCTDFANAVLHKQSTFLLPKTRRQLLLGAAAISIAATGFFAWPSSKPVELRLKQRFDKPESMVAKNENLEVQQVVGTVMADRTGGRMDKYDYYVLGNGLKGAFVWDGSTGKLLRHLTSAPGFAVALPSNERPWCLTGENDGVLRKWSLTNGTNLETIPAHENSQQIRSINISPDTYQIVTASTDRSIKVWEFSKSRQAPVQTLKTESFVTVARFCSNGRSLASVESDGLLQFWDRSTGQPFKKIDASNARLWAMDISPDGNFVLTGGVDRKVKLWDLSNGTLIKEFIGHDSDVHCVSFTENSDMVCSGSFDRTLRFWNIHTGKEVQRATHPREVLGVSPANYRGNGNVHLTATPDTIFAWEPVK
jgi:serine/threonine protein kinase